jgi:hypothetical protein
MEELKFDVKDALNPMEYLRINTGVSDMLITDADPHMQNIRIGIVRTIGPIDKHSSWQSRHRRRCHDTGEKCFRRPIPQPASRLPAKLPSSIRYPNDGIFFYRHALPRPQMHALFTRTFASAISCL